MLDGSFATVKRHSPLLCFCSSLPKRPQVPAGDTHFDSGVHCSYQGCCWTQRKGRTWKARQMRIWVRTEKSSGAEMRPEGGGRGTSSFHAGFKLTGGAESRESERHASQWIQYSKNVTIL
jgi:hypothetical protein